MERRSSGPIAREILERRYAAREIPNERYEQKKRNLA
jgi:uncharacterized membrane protein